MYIRQAADPLLLSEREKQPLHHLHHRRNLFPLMMRMLFIFSK